MQTSSSHEFFDSPLRNVAAESTLRDARIALSNNHPERVIQSLASAKPLQQSHHDIEPAVLLGLAYHHLGRALESADALEKASLLGPIPDEARVALASSYAELRRTDLARDLFLELAISRRLPPGLMLQVAAGLAAIDSPQLAMKVCEWITESDDTVAQAYFDMGVYSARCGNELYITEALTRRALQLDSKNLHYQVGLASLLIQLRREDEAIEAMTLVNVDNIHQATCFSCLERIAELLSRRERHELASACRTQAKRLRDDASAPKPC
ncbi:hypothetical protein LOC71_07845 [Rhodopirellula sp. JC740]|uniref:Tetratricopeptide repeat protein n=1 Tax=Rhodopirellula halodulae TaxID=2894198 RepID=A0ABS8NF53_9BACT|nr:hypothetical protein [Rhodopirellula sp. JC740]MCC9642182.1 hypothetical protein [Rhodopirellula sp. JC740]